MKKNFEVCAVMHNARDQKTTHHWEKFSVIIKASCESEAVRKAWQDVHAWLDKRPNATAPDSLIVTRVDKC